MTKFTHSFCASPCFHKIIWIVPFLSHRNLPYCISEANIRQICTWWVSRKQCSGHKPPANYRRAEGQTPLLPEPVMVLFSLPVWLSVSLSSLHPLLTSAVMQLSSLMGCEVSDNKTLVFSIPFCCSFHSSTFVFLFFLLYFQENPCLKI